MIQKNQNKREYLPFFGFSMNDATTAKGLGCDEETSLRLRDFAVVSLMPTRAGILFISLPIDSLFTLANVT